VVEKNFIYFIYRFGQSRTEISLTSNCKG